MPLRAVALGTDRELAENPADREAVERCLAGDRDAFAAIVRRYGSSLIGFCARMVGPAVGEELAQEAFARAYSGLAGFRSDARLKHWLYRIALNLCRDYVKSGRARTELLCGPDAGPEPMDDEASPEQRAIGRQTIGALERAIEKLPPKYREAFILKHVENLSYEEMQPIVKMPVVAMKVRVHRAREMLRKAMGEEETP